MAKQKQKQITFKTTKKITENVIDEVIAIKEQYGLTAENIIKKAKNKNSSLHDLFEWNDTIAGEQYRLNQARVFINEIKIVVDEVEVFAFENVRVGNNGDSERKYLEVSEIMCSRELKEQVITQALNQMNYWKSKYANYKELKPVVDAIDKVNEKWLKN